MKNYCSKSVTHRLSEGDGPKDRDKIRKHKEGLQTCHRVSQEDQPVDMTGRRHKIHTGTEKDKVT